MLAFEAQRVALLRPLRRCGQEGAERPNRRSVRIAARGVLASTLRGACEAPRPFEGARPFGLHCGRSNV